MTLHYDKIAAIYDATRAIPQGVDEQVTDFILQLVKAKPETKFLEIGIGTGIIAIPIIKRGYSYTGIDISQKMMQQIGRKLQGVPSNLTLIQADASSLSMFEDNSFDVVLMRHVIHLISDWRSALAEIRRVLKPNGFFLYCETVLTPHQKEFEQQWRQIAEKAEGFQKPGYEAEDRADIEDVKRWLIEQGATIETVTAVKWRVEQTVGKLLDIYQTKPFGSCWVVPDNVFPSVMRDFREWCRKHYGSFDVILASDATFDILQSCFQEFIT